MAHGISLPWAPDLAPLFQRPGRTGVDSAWYGHVPFAHWIVAALRPGRLVELGTHNGVSYSAFCEAVQREDLPTRCTAVDTWQGDAHAGQYGEEVHAELRAFHDARFAGFSTLLRCRFDEALPSFADGSIDLLHIDGLHSRDAVRHDFEAWRPKLSPRAAVLFHDTAERDHGFEVWRVWAELRDHYPSFEFTHAHGLGVLGVGADLPPALAALLALDAPTADAVRDRFALLGERWVAAYQLQLYGRALHDLEAKHAALAAAQDAVRAERDAAVGRAAEADHRSARTQATLEAAEADAAGLAQRLQDSERHAATLDATVTEILGSTYWRVGRPLRAAMAWVPGPLRRVLRAAPR